MGAGGPYPLGGHEGSLADSEHPVLIPPGLFGFQREGAVYSASSGKVNRMPGVTMPPRSPTVTLP